MPTSSVEALRVNRASPLEPIRDKLEGILRFHPLPPWVSESMNQNDRVGTYKILTDTEVTRFLWSELGALELPVEREKLGCLYRLAYELSQKEWKLIDPYKQLPKSRRFTEREIQILILRHLMGVNADEIASILGMTPMRVRVIDTKVKYQLRDYLVYREKVAQP